MTNPAQNPNTALDAIIGENVHQLMWRARVSQTQLALSLGMTQGALSRKVRGDRPWYADEIAGVAGYFHIDIAALFTPGGALTQKGPVTEVTGPNSLPELDSNQQPAGYKPALYPSVADDLERHRRSKTSAHKAVATIRTATITAITKAAN
jgi:transcriptional regulator with XRE-family HTH domain